MNKIKNKNGFTMVEILVVIAIIAILATIVIPAITNNMNESKNKYNNGLKEQLLIAGKEYFSENKHLLPVNQYNEKTIIKNAYVTAVELKSKNYIKNDFVDSENNSCGDSFVLVRQAFNSDYDWHACLKCGGINKSINDKYCDIQNWQDNINPACKISFNQTLVTDDNYQSLIFDELNDEDNDIDYDSKNSEKKFSYIKITNKSKEEKYIDVSDWTISELKEYKVGKELLKLGNGIYTISVLDKGMNETICISNIEVQASGVAPDDEYQEESTEIIEDKPTNNICYITGNYLSKNNNKNTLTFSNLSSLYDYSHINITGPDNTESKTKSISVSNKSISEIKSLTSDIRDYIVQEEGKYNIDIVTTSGKIVRCASDRVVDNTKPSCTLEYNNETNKLSFKTVNDGYMYSIVDNSEESNYLNKKQEVTIPKYGTNTYRGDIIDKAGNDGTCKLKFTRYYYDKDTGYGLGKATSISIKWNTKSGAKGRCGKGKGDYCAAKATVKYPIKTVTYYVGYQNNSGLRPGSCSLHSFMGVANAINGTYKSSLDLQKYLIKIGVKGKFWKSGVTKSVNYYGLKANIYHNELSQKKAANLIKKALDNGQPVMVVVSNKKCSDLAGTHHTILLLGYNSKGKVIFVDSVPYARRSSGKRGVTAMSKCMSTGAVANTYYRMIIFSYK